MARKLNKKLYKLNKLTLIKTFHSFLLKKTLEPHQYLTFDIIKPND